MQIYADYYRYGYGDGCSSRSLSATQPTDQQVNVSGRWAGTTTVSTAVMLGGGCLGDQLRAADFPIRNEVVFNFSQSGARVVGSQIAVAVGNEALTNSCELMGIVVENDLHGTVCDGRTEDVGVVTGCGSEPWIIEWEPILFSGTVNGASMDVTITERGVVQNGTASFGISSSEHFTLEK